MSGMWLFKTRGDCDPVRRAGARIGVVLIGAILAGGALAGTLAGKVVGIADGDTLTVLDAQRTQHKIRLAGIDAPEKKQAFGNRSKEHLSSLVFGRHVMVEAAKQDRYGRTIGKVIIDGKDANLAMVVAGLAWHYKQYRREQSPTDRLLYAGAEQEARSARRGLWRDPSPVAPWDHRSEIRDRRTKPAEQGGR